MVFPIAMPVGENYVVNQNDSEGLHYNIRRISSGNGVLNPGSEKGQSIQK